MKEICPNLHNKQVAKEFGELKDLFGEDTAYLLCSKNNGYSIDKAPNGADSILFQNLLDRTKNRQQALIEKAKIYLYPKRDHVLKQLSRMGLFGHQLNTTELLSEFYTIYNPEEEENV